MLSRQNTPALPTALSSTSDLRGVYGRTEESRAEELAQAAAKAEQTGMRPLQANLRGLYVHVALRSRMKSLPAGKTLRYKGTDAKMWKALQMEKAGSLETDILLVFSAELHAPA